MAPPQNCNFYPGNKNITSEISQPNQLFSFTDLFHNEVPDVLIDECAFGEVDETIRVEGWVAIVHKG